MFVTQTVSIFTLLSRLRALAMNMSITIPRMLARLSMTKTFGSLKFWMAMMTPAAVLR